MASLLLPSGRFAQTSVGRTQPWRRAAADAVRAALAHPASPAPGVRFRNHKAQPSSGQRSGTQGTAGHASRFGQGSTSHHFRGPSGRNPGHSAAGNKARYPARSGAGAQQTNIIRRQARKKPLSPDEIRNLLLDRLPIWAASARATKKLGNLGFDSRTATRCLLGFSQEAVRNLKGKRKADDSDLRDWDAESLKFAPGMNLDSVEAVEKVLLRRCLEWCATVGAERELISQTLAIRLQDILQATDLRDSAQDYPEARQLQRHFHLHIGPTNSGKTYNALKALASAPSGAYAGPLRLLAHEVWERLNLGTVGNLKEGQGRECNLLTGEEVRNVSEAAALTSCTVEMLPLGRPMDVVVIDEIQMIADPARGAAWTTALLGVCAREVHLCGEETVVDVVTKLVEDIGDKMTIHRYERLTPLKISETSLEGDLGRIEDGDCIVCFSRSMIFATKKLIEEQTGKRCAVVYGALPPETRSEQAKLFNEEGNGVNVMVASDAVGMGLNLKIKRMVFEAMSKYNGVEEVPLSVSQVKQIAGRAGRFGLHDSSSGGIVTTLNKRDLPLLKTILPSNLPTVPQIAMDTNFARIHKLAMLLGGDLSFTNILETFAELARLPPYGFFSNIMGRVKLTDHLKGYTQDLTVAEAELFSYAPVNDRDANVVSAFKSYIRDFVDEGRVEVERALAETGLLDNFELVDQARQELPDGDLSGIAQPGVFLTPIPERIVLALPKLESLHKALVLYIWLSFRRELAFPERIKAVEMKEKAEELLDFCLERLPGVERAAKRLLGRRHRKQQIRSLVVEQPKKPKTLKWLTRDEAVRVRVAQRFGNIEILQN